MTGGPRIFSIPAGVPFVDALAEGMLAEAAGDPLRLAEMTVLLPTRRAGRALREAFLRHAGGRPLLLPRMTPLGDVDADELVLAPADEAGPETGLESPLAIGGLARQMLLARMVLAWGAARPPEEVGPAGAPSPGQAAALAGELARLLDQLQTEGIDPARLAELGGDFAHHWERTLSFLGILTDAWPALLAERDLADPARRRDQLLRRQAEQWRRTPPAAPVYAAGSTGSIPATAQLLAVVARLPNGAVVLPGLDNRGDPLLWPAIAADPTHPQHGMARLLDALGVAPHTVPDWPWPAGAGTAPRARLFGEALRPAVATEVWTRPEWRQAAGLGPAGIDRALEGIARIDCPGPHEEAGAVALLLREVLETPGRTAALVTTDRALARRVAAELARWGVAVDDSAGTPLDQTPPGTFLRLLAAALAEAAAPVPLLALLKHPLAAGGMADGRFRRRVRRLETAVLRGPRPAPGLAGIAATLAAAGAALPPGDRRAGPLAVLGAFAGALERQMRPLAEALAAPAVDLATLVRAHVAAAEALAASDREAGAARLWRGEAGEAAARFVADLLAAAADFPPIAGAAYPGLFEALAGGVAVRPAYGSHPRLHIWGPLEARLQQADRLVLGGLNESTWPGVARSDPWLSRPMRARLGLPAPERRIGLAAHDFVQAAAASEVFLTRAVKVEGTPTVASRWLLRLDTMLAALGRTIPRAAAPRVWQQRLDDRDAGADGVPVARPARPQPPPRPCPPVALRPRSLRVTEIETWLADPYAIYARHLLGLRALDPIDMDPGAAERGTMIHHALDRFVAACPPPLPLPADARDRLLAFGREALAELLERPIVRAFWWPRFARIADWFLAEEAARRAAIAQSWTECGGSWTIPGPAGPFRLSGRADRIDRLHGGAAAIIDYKTGSAPNKAAVERGRAPQLPLEAAMVAAGAFAGVPQQPVAELAYWRLSGAAPAGEIVPIAATRERVEALAADARDGLAALVARFDDPATPYLAQPRPDWVPRFSDYTHLARVGEWADGAAENEE
ncbi:double-strand break repair protein AddB [Stella sp.]|uniref:double-strand break repair protein AddB n=1 Tax=Stella sp. TaxID=2912054 RepID=UPI0035AF5CAD